MEMTLTERCLWMLSDNGASLAGAADLNGISVSAYPYGIAIALALPPDVVSGITERPTMAYFDAYHALNAQLDALALRCAAFLQDEGYRAEAQTMTVVTEYGDHRTPLPHKTVATRAGLGWIGKCALLVTPAYGSAVRLTSVLTDAPLVPNAPAVVSCCGECTACATHCPAHAVSGRLWSPGLDRNELLDPIRCRTEARKRAATALGKEITLCGRCIVACPYTQQYLSEHAATIGMRSC